MRTINFPLIAILLSWLALLLAWTPWLGLPFRFSLLVVILQLTSLILIITHVEVIFSPEAMLSRRSEFASGMLLAGLIGIITFLLPVNSLSLASGVRPAVLECSLPPEIYPCSIVSGLDMIERGLWLPLGLANFLGGLR